MLTVTPTQAPLNKTKANLSKLLPKIANHIFTQKTTQPRPAQRSQKTAKTETEKSQYRTLILERQTHHASQDMLNAQRLRTLCFSEAFAVEFTGFNPQSEQPLDSDAFDNYCTHVLIYDDSRRDSYGQPLLIATTRLLDRSSAVAVGQFYSENEFKLGQLLGEYPYNVLEIGRTCIHSDYRHLLAINQLWKAIGKIAQQRDVNGFMGCASILLENNNPDVQGWLDNLSDNQKLPIKARKKLPPTTAENLELTNFHRQLDLPALLKMYIRMGCTVGATACYDSEFNCADVFIWLPFEQIKPRYKHLIE